MVAATEVAREVDQRGRLEVRTRGLTHLVESAAREVPGVRSAEASLTVQGSRARVAVRVRVAYGRDLDEAARGVRMALLDRAAGLAGIPLGPVDVTVEVVV